MSGLEGAGAISLGAPRCPALGWGECPTPGLLARRAGAIRRGAGVPCPGELGAMWHMTSSSLGEEDEGPTTGSSET